ncbi:MAG: phosphoadenosine phosphosulfate reductase family protein [Bacteroidales bacterium]|jgi:3'-phosphoadenosine 5'-phosphosulfate sulfotransferase (PAPS reductase)/FAD synthetase|nr:phosphoadenosine phosphosulfate reductase family protein [Bacteroidales bacterium]
MKSDRHIVSFSGGKDSTAMLLLLLEQGRRIDEVVWFDAETWEFPEMQRHIDKVEVYTGLKITRLKPKKSFDYWFSDHIITKGKNKGTKGYGFPSMSRRWCTREKIRTIDKYLNGAHTLYLGYAFNEIDRVKNNNSNNKNILYPLIEAKITEDQALTICKQHGFNWDGLYELFSRVSCWNCPNQSREELMNLYTYKPELWKRLQEMQNKSWNSFKMDYTRVETFTKQFNDMKKYPNRKKKSVKTLHYTEVDECFYSSAEPCVYGISKNYDNAYIPKDDWERNWTVTSSRTNRVAHVGKTRQSCADFIEKRTGKMVSFVSNERYLKEVAKHNRL